MLYDLPKVMRERNYEVPLWPEGVGFISAELQDGTPVRLPLYKDINCLTFGTVGSGKTFSFTTQAAEILLNADPTKKGVFFEIKHSFIDKFMGPGDKVITRNPNAVAKDHLFIPNMIKEIKQSADPEAEMTELGEFLFSDLLEGANQNRAWVDAAQQTFIGILRTTACCFASCSNRALINSMRKMSEIEILRYLAKHQKHHSILKKTWGFDPEHPEDYRPSKRSSDILFMFSSVLEKFSGSFELEGEDTIHDWLNGQQGRNLFFLYDLQAAESCRPFFCYYLKKIKDYKLSNVSRANPPILMVLDELDKMADGGKDASWGLFQAGNLGREYGLQILLTTQSLENLYGLSPNFNQHITIGGLAGFPYLVSFRTGDPETISTLQKLYGSEYKRHLVLPASRYAEPVEKYDLEPIINDAEFASLNLGDCVVKILGCRPQKIHIKMPTKK